MNRIGLGGGCHWCTEAVFQILNGVTKVEQGFIASKLEQRQFCEAVILHFEPGTICLFELIEIHLNTHNCSSTRSLRKGYCSAIYVFDPEQEMVAHQILEKLRKKFKEEIITQVLQFQKFKPSPEKYRNYYFKDPKRPFCQTYITPKIHKLEEHFPENLIYKSGDQ